MQDILVTIGAVSKNFKINSLQFINNVNMDTFPSGVQKENLLCFLLIKVIEWTINKDQKGLGGIIAISTSEVSMEQWILSCNNTDILIADLKKNLDTGDSTAKNLSLKQIRYD